MFYKTAWTMGAQWASFPRELLFWVSLTPIAIANINTGLKEFGSPVSIPLSWGTMVAIGVVASVVAFGILSYTRFGFPRRASEIGSKVNPWVLLFYTEMKRIQEKQKELEEKYLKDKNKK